MSLEFFMACERLLSATANGVYQGMLVAALAGLALRLFPRTNAATRHAVWFGVLLLVAALIPAHLLLSGRPHPEILAATTRPSANTVAAAPVPYDSGSPASSPIAIAADSDSQPDVSAASGMDEAPYVPSAESHGQLAATDIGSESRPAWVTTENAWPVVLRAILKPLSWNLETAIRLPHWLCLCLVCGWVLLASVRGGLIAGRIGEVRRVKITSSAPSQALQALFERLCGSLATRRNVRLRVSSTHRTAGVLGFVHPVVLLPAEMDKEENDCEAEHVLRHELAHVDRWDDWGNLAQQVIEAALFFHPAVWWISAKLSLEREIACDDHVLEASGRPRDYALTLANVASRMNQCRTLLAPGVSNNNTQLQKRITMILNTQRDRSPRLAKRRLGFFTTATALLAVLALTAGPRLVLAQSSADAPSASVSGDNAPPPPPDAPATQPSPAALPPDSGAESGPRSKSDQSGSSSNYVPPAGPVLLLTQPPAPVAPFGTVRTAVEVHPVIVAAAATDAEVQTMLPPLPPGRHGKRNMSVEERLDRVERMLENLEAQGDGNGRHRSAEDSQPGAGLFRKDAPDQWTERNFDFQFKRAAEEAKRAAEQAQRAAEAGQRAAEAGQRAAEAGQRHAEQAMGDFAKLKNKDFERLHENLRDMQSQGPVIELQALRSARESLQKEVQNLERQIKRLEEDQNRQKKPADGRPDGSDDGKFQPSAPENK